MREITFENAEELTEEGLPFLILFYAPGDDDAIKRYNDIVQRELLGDKREWNLLQDYTVWKFQDFSIIQILREIKCEDYRSCKTAVLTILGALKMIN